MNCDVCGMVIHNDEKRKYGCMHCMGKTPRIPTEYPLRGKSGKVTGFVAL